MIDSVPWKRTPDGGRAAAGALRVSVLGFVGVTSPHGRPVPLAGAKTRLLMAMLACRTDRASSTDVLIEALWGERPVRSAHANLQNYVSRIRGALAQAEPGGAQRLAHQSGAYRLHLDEASSDVQELTVLYTRAVEPGGAAADTLPLLDRAHALWRGRPFSAAAADVSVTVAGEQRRCEEMYLRLCEERARATLAVGGAARAVVQLRRLVGEFPLRERLHALLVGALHECGEHAAAVLAYRDAESVLARELGVRPGPELRDLHSRVLRQAV